MKYIFITICLVVLFITPSFAEKGLSLDTAPKNVQDLYALAGTYGHASPIALNLYKKLAEENYTLAQYKLAELYFTGYSSHFSSPRSGRVLADFKKAKHWYKKAAENGHGESQLRLAFLYAENHFEGLEIDYNLAEKWFKKAAEQNAGDARFRLGNFYQHYLKPPQYDKAFHWLEIAAKDGHSVAQYDLANFYLQGKGSTKIDKNKWFYWINKAAKQDNLHALIALSKAYGNGENNIEKNTQKSIALAIRVANKNFSRIWYIRIADAFFEGEGNLPKSYARAKPWYEKAAVKRSEHAKERLEIINNSTPK